MRHQRSHKGNVEGFTIVELVVVLIVLGILAAAALPRFLNLTSAARKSATDSITGSMHTAAQLAVSQARLEGKERLTGAQIVMQNATITLAYGAPAGDQNILASAQIKDADVYGRFRDNTQHRWVVQYIRSTDNRFGIEMALGEVVGPPTAPNPKDTGCFVRYVEASATKSYRIDSDTSRC